MKKLIILTLTASLSLAGCAANSKFCTDPTMVNSIKAQIHSALQIAQVSYPVVASYVGLGATSPAVAGAIAAVDSSLDGLGKLAYDVLCPGLTELQKAQRLLDKAQAAKAALGVK